MPLLHTPVLISRTCAGGAWSFNTQTFSKGKITQIIVKAAAATTTFDFYIQDKDDDYVFDTRTGGGKATGTLRREVQIPVRGIYTLGVINSSVATSTFTGKIMVEEG